MSLSFMRRIPPRKLVPLAKRYFSRDVVRPLLVSAEVVEVEKHGQRAEAGLVTDEQVAWVWVGVEEAVGEHLLCPGLAHARDEEAQIDAWLRLGLGLGLG